VTKRNTALRDRHRFLLRRVEAPCHICGRPIDYGLPHMDPGEFVVDHVIPLSRGGTDTIDNKAAAHRACNGTKGGSAQPLQLKRSGSLNR